ACQRRPATDVTCAIRFPIPPPAGTRFAPSDRPAVSPDGSTLAAVVTDPDGRSRMWLQSLVRPAAEPVGGTDGASFPFWSPAGALFTRRVRDARPAPVRRGRRAVRPAVRYERPDHLRTIVRYRALDRPRAIRPGVDQHLGRRISGGLCQRGIRNRLGRCGWR